MPLPEAASPPGLPVDLQYLPQDKQREEEPDIRKMLLEAIMLVGPCGANHGGAEGRAWVGAPGSRRVFRAALEHAVCREILTEKR